MENLELAKYIDHAVLDPQMTEQELYNAIMIGVNYHCKTVCVNPSTIEIAKKCIKGSTTQLCVVCDFPFGQSTTSSRIDQVLNIIQQGDIDEIDIVANYGLIKSGKVDEVSEDIKQISKLCHEYHVLLKVIVETDALTKDEVKKAVSCCIAGNADYIKTSTGYFKGNHNVGASLDVIELIVNEAKGKIKVKGSGHIRDRKKLLDLIELGIDRAGVGYKSTEIILKENAYEK